MRGDYLCFSLVLAWLTFTSSAPGQCDQTVPTFASGKSPTAEIHVAPGGSNDTGSGSAGNPYETLAFAASLATPGTAIIMQPGTYQGGTFLYDLAGTAEAPIWIGGASPDNRPIIDGGSEGLHFIRCTYLVVRNLEVRNAANNGINCDDGGEYDNPLATHHLLFEGLYIHDIGGTGNQDGLKLSGLDDYFVINCDFERCGGGVSGSGIDHVGCHHGLIAGCTFEEMSGNAIQCKGGSEDIEIKWCRITDGGQRGVNIGGSTGFEFVRPSLSETKPNAEARDIRVVCNVFEGCVAAFAFVGCVDCVVANNTIITPDNWLFRILQETTTSGDYEFLPCSDNRMENNLVYFDRSELSTYVNIGPNTEPSSFTFASNLWYAFDNPSQSQPPLPAVETGGIDGVDPLLANPSAGDYQPSELSPAAGTSVAALLVGTDFAGNCYQCPAGIGAFEGRDFSADLNHDGIVGLADLLSVLGSWSSNDADGDANGDDDVNLADLLQILAQWGTACWE